MQPLIRAIYNGLFRPSGLSVIAALITLLSCLAGYGILVTPETFLNLAPRLYNEGGDQSVRLTKTILTLQTNNFELAPSIYIVGDSTLDEGLDINRLSRYFHSRESPLQIVNLISGGQSILEAMAAIDNLPSSTEGVVILGHSLRKLLITKAQIGIAQQGARRGYKSDAVNSFLQQYGVSPQKSYGLYSLDTFWFTAPRIFRYYFSQLKSNNKSETVATRNEYDISPEELLSKETFYMTTIDPDFPSFIEKLATGREALKQIKNRVDQYENLQLILIETPLNPSVVKNHIGSVYYQNYLDNIRTFSDENNINYHNAAKQSNFSEEDFHDVLHLKSSAAVKRFTNTVTKIVDNSLHE